MPRDERQLELIEGATRNEYEAWSRPQSVLCGVCDRRPATRRVRGGIKCCLGCLARILRDGSLR